jgi:branched-chain amino acid transport system substrate-binding protein
VLHCTAMKIGLLIPRSALYPTMGFDLVSGVHASLKSQSLGDYKLDVANIGVATDNNQIYATCEQFLLNGTDVVIAYLNPRNVEAVHGLFAAANKPLIVLDSGFHYPALHKYSHVAFLSLHGTLCAWLTAEWAMADGHKKFVYTSSFYDAGYRSPNAFATPILKGSGELMFNYITPLKKSAFTIAPLIQFLESQNTQAVIASFCGDMAADFLTHYAHYAIHGKTHPIYASSFMLEDVLTNTLPTLPFEVKGFVPWYQKLELPENKKFMDSLRSLEYKNGNVFSLLAWEAGQICLELNSKNLSSADALNNLQFQSPRGTVTMNPHTHIGDCDCYPVLYSKGETTPGQYTPEPTLTASYYQHVKNYSHITDSWYNAYPCLID